MSKLKILRCVSDVPVFMDLDQDLAYLDYDRRVMMMKLLQEASNDFVLVSSRYLDSEHKVVKDRRDAAFFQREFSLAVAFEQEQIMTFAKNAALDELKFCYNLAKDFSDNKISNKLRKRARTKYGVEL